MHDAPVCGRIHLDSAFQLPDQILTMAFLGVSSRFRGQGLEHARGIYIDMYDTVLDYLDQVIHVSYVTLQLQLPVIDTR